MSDSITKPRYNCVVLTNGSEVVSEVNGRQISRLERIREILLEESDARWLIQRLIERGIVYTERDW